MSSPAASLFGHGSCGGSVLCRRTRVLIADWLRLLCKAAWIGLEDRCLSSPALCQQNGLGLAPQPILPTLPSTSRHTPSKPSTHRPNPGVKPVSPRRRAR